MPRGGKAYEVMGINNRLEQLPANYILQLIKNVKYNPKAVDINIIQYMNHYYHEGHHPIVGVIEKKKKMVIDKTNRDTNNSSEYELSVLGSAIFKKDKLIGYLLGNDTKAVNYLMNNIKGIMNLARLGEITIPFIIILFFILALLGFKNYNFQIFLPILKDSKLADINKGAIISSLRYIDILIITMLIPYLDDKKVVNKLFLKALIYSMIIVVISVVVVQLH